MPKPSAPICPEGSPDHRFIILPKAALELSRRHQMLSALHPTRAGHFPNAAGHDVFRKRGVPEAILIHCVQGAGWYAINGGPRQPVAAGATLILRPGVWHAYGADDHAPWSITWVHFRGKALRSLLPLLFRDRGQAATLAKTPHESQEALSAMLDSYADGFSFANLFAATTELQACLARILLRRRAVSRKSSEAEERIDAAIRWMQEHPDSSLPLSQIARNAGYSVPHFVHLFRTRTDASPLSYFLRLKIRRACHLLDTTTSPIKSVAAQVGFADPYYFSRMFRKVMGYSPRAYQKMDKI